MTGSNSSGKSSVNKSLALLKTYVDSVKEDLRKGVTPNLSAHKLDFSKTSATLNLGNFHQVLHRGSKEESISFEVTTHSRLLGEDVVVELTFIPDPNDIQDNGYLSNLEIKKVSGELLYQSGQDSDHFMGKYISAGNFNLLKDSFFKFFNTILYWDIIFEGTPLNDAPDFYKYFAKQWGYDTNSMDDVDYICRHIFKEKLETYKTIVNDYSRDYLNVVKEFCYSSENMLNVEGSPMGDNPYIREAHEVLNHNYSIFEKAFQYNSLFLMPVLEEIWDMEKTEVRQYLMSNVSDKYQAPLNIIIEDFEKSEFTAFGEYFKDKEREYFYLDIRRKRILTLPKAEDFSDLLMINWRDWINDDEILHQAEDALSHLSKKSDKCRNIYNDLASLDKNGLIKWQKNELCHLTAILEILNPNAQNHQYELEALDHLYESFSLFTHFVEWTYEDIVATMLPNEMSYFGPNSADVKRLYTEGSFFTTLSAYLECKRSFLNLLSDDYDHPQKASFIPIESGFKPGDFINKWLKALGVADELLITQVEDGLGLKVSTFNNNNEKTLLADQGVGVTQLVALLLRIETLIMDNILHHSKMWRSSNQDEVRCEKSLIILEEPEMHLHPKYQSLLADIFLEAYEKYNIHFIVETHSEYLIRKSQVIVAEANYADEKELNAENPFMVYYLPDNGKPYKMEYRTDGKFSNEFGSGFFDEASNLLFNIL